MGEGEQSELLFPLQMRSIELLILSVLSGSDLTFCQIQYFQGPPKQSVHLCTGGCKAEYPCWERCPWIFQPRIPKV